MSDSISKKHPAANHTAATPAPHFRKVKRTASAWKTQEVATGQVSGSEAEISPGSKSVVDANPQIGWTTSEVVVPQALPEQPNPPSEEVIQRVDAPNKFSRRPHYRPIQKLQKPQPVETSFGSFMVPVADSSMMPPKNIVPSAETFAGDKVVDRLDFLPSWEVDQFEWPLITTELLYQHDPLFADLSSMISESILRSQKRLAITGVARGEGRTTLTITLARKLANDGQRVLIVDTDLVHPSLGKSLNLDGDITWLSDRTEFETAAEMLVGNHESQICVMPLQPSTRASFNRHAYELLDLTLKKIEPFFDTVLMDFGQVAQIDASNFRSTNLASSALLVHNANCSNVEQYKHAFEKFQTLGFWRFGLIENGSRAF